AATAVAARRLARPDSSRVAILGCGVQGRTNLRALCEVLPIASVAAYDVARGAAERYAEEMAPALAVEIQVAQDPQAAVRGADVVVTAGPIQREAHRTIEAGWTEPGAFVSAVDYDSYFQPAALHEMHKFCTDDVAQLEVARSKGHFPDTPPIHAEIGELVAGLKPGRESADERTMTANLGLAIHDMAVAPLVVARARERGLGVELPGAG
ncbi:MAG: hypothetical protein GF320_13835, partial [Armatimonadia bacterium]|nr:hypothetical protein [Armatimonadia bacterium]